MGVEFFSGVCMATFFASGIFFLKFWKTSRDRFFLLFCLACWLIGVERVMLLILSEPNLSSPETDSISWIYLIRLAAFCMILVAIIDKNRGKVR